MPDFTKKYNTPLSKAEEKAFQEWAVSESKKQGRNVLMDLQDYDLRGFWKNSQGYDDRGHGTDEFKKPNHPTFSTESKYNGVDGNKGGEWVETPQGFKFKASETQLKFYSPTELEDYFNRVEPGVKLEMPLSASQLLRKN